MRLRNDRLWSALFAFLVFSSTLAHGQEEIEPNDQCAEAQIIGAPLTLPFVTSGSLDTPPELPDVDFFRFSAQAGVELVAELKGSTTGAGTLQDPFLGLFDADCNGIAANDDFGSADSRLRFVVPSDGVFVLAATSCCDNGFAGTGGSAGTYELAVVEAPPPSCPAPTELGLPATIDGSASGEDCLQAELFGNPFDPGFVDQYSVTLPVNGILSVSLDFVAFGGSFEIWDSELDERLFRSFRFGGLSLSGSEFLQAGVYNILVSHSDAQTIPVPYSLSVSLEETNEDPGVALLAAVLPGIRSAEVGSLVTGFATIINAGSVPGIACGITPITEVPAEFLYRARSSNNKAPLPANVPVDIPSWEAARNFVFAFQPSEPFDLTEIEFDFSCENSASVPVFNGLNTMLLSASADPVPDIMANAATLCNDGIVRLSPVTGVGVFAAAATNLGAGDVLTVSVDSGEVGLPVSVSICQTDSLGRCSNPPNPSEDTVSVTLDSDEVATFGFFATGSAPIDAEPVSNRLFVRFTDSSGVLRGATSVAVQTRGTSFFECP